ncbi:ABC transporter permease [Microbispora catharanthi]|uniref:FtsX-like permease family protein n=1 Tax=Microbispora catharanthi TaxID=1712871 RepID=A0A5N6C5T7_9ACTN|nr:FtsX-like permease family protein [Microbispora catharanthi]KAB8188059.1 FtsX-like permease family protein [Microbispora catharanthi]
MRWPLSRLLLRKILRDMWLARTRMVMMTLAIALSVTAVGAFLSARAILGREISRNYLETRPASATVRVPGGVDAATLAAVKAQPGVLDATTRASFPARLKIGNGPWRMSLLFVSHAADPQRISRVTMQRGAWPPPPGGLVLERTALAFLDAEVGQAITVQVPGTVPASVTVTGSAHDGGVAPADQEQTAYAYTTDATLARLGVRSAPDELKVVIGDRTGPSGSRDVIETDVQRVAALLRARGFPVSRIEVPRPLEHPHQGQMEMVGFTLLAFGAAALLLSSVLVAALLGGLVTGQIRQIGAMKAVGARTGQILALYLTLTAILSVLATALALPTGAALGRALAAQGARLLNLDLFSLAIPPWAYALQITAGIFVPVLVALMPLVRGSRITVRAAIDDHGLDADAPARSWNGRLTTRLGGPSRLHTLATRNVLRRRGRLVLNVGLLAVAGAMFLTGLNTATGWNALVQEGTAHRADDLEIRLARPAPAARLVELARGVPGVVAAEAWARAGTTVHVPGRVDVARVYPDDAHGSFTMLAPPAATPLLRLPVEQGRWLRPADVGTVVLNNLASAQLPGIRIGDRVSLTVDGRPTTWRVAGIVSDFGSQATAYTTDRQYASVTGETGQAGLLRVVTARHDTGARQAVLDRIEAALEGDGVAVERSFRADELRAALDGHVLVLADALIGLGVVMGLVGLLGLAAGLVTAVTERTREFGVLHAIGATSTVVRGIVVAEGGFTAAISLPVAALAALPLTRLLGDFVGANAFRQPLPFRFNAPALLVWSLLALAGAALAATAAARRASRLTVRNALVTL